MTRRVSTSSSSLLPRARPEDHGVAPSAIAAFIDGLTRTGGAHGFLVLRDGAVLAEGWWDPYTAELPHSMYSVSKAFTSVAIGLAIAEGFLSIDDRAIDLLPDDVPDQISDHLAALQVRHLLTMTSGHAVDTIEALHLAADGDWARAILATELTHEPGAVFVYNSGATYLLSAIISRVTGVGLLEYLGPRLLEPLGITGATWQLSPVGIATGGWGLSITTEQLAVFGEFCRREGEWAGVQLVPVEWMRAATSFQVSTDGDERDDAPLDWREGYGYQFWRCRHDAYRADGAFGQFAVVLPEQRMVVALTSGLPDGAPLLDLIWEHLLPGVDVALTAAHTPTRLVLPTPQGAATSAVPRRTLTFSAQTTTAAARRFGLDGSPLELRDLGGEFSIPVGHAAWCPSEVTHRGVRVPLAAAGAWTDTTTWVAHVWLTETPFRVTLTLTDDGTSAQLEVSVTPSFDATEFATLRGHHDADKASPLSAPDGAWILSAKVAESGAVSIGLTEAAR